MQLYQGPETLSCSFTSETNPRIVVFCFVFLLDTSWSQEIRASDVALDINISFELWTVFMSFALWIAQCFNCYCLPLWSWFNCWFATWVVQRVCGGKSDKINIIFLLSCPMSQRVVLAAFSLGNSSDFCALHSPDSSCFLCAHLPWCKDPLSRLLSVSCSWGQCLGSTWSLFVI